MRHRKVRKGIAHQRDAVLGVVVLQARATDDVREGGEVERHAAGVLPVTRLKVQAVAIEHRRRDLRDVVMLAAEEGREGAHGREVVLRPAALPGGHLRGIVREVQSEAPVPAARHHPHDRIDVEGVEHVRVHLRDDVPHLVDEVLDAPQQSRILRLQLRGQLVRARLYRGAQVARHPVLRNTNAYQVRPVTAPKAVIYYRLEGRRSHCPRRLSGHPSPQNIGPEPRRRKAGETW